MEEDTGELPPHLRQQQQQQPQCNQEDGAGVSSDEEEDVPDLTLQEEKVI